MKEIGLNLGVSAIVDADDFERVNNYKWLAKTSRVGGKHYARRNTSVNGKRKTLWMHRVIMDAPEEVECDHINGNTLDNRKDNLRLCNRAENSKNRGVSKNNKLGIKGVYQASDRSKFVAQIGVNNKHIKLGYYNVLGDADSAYRIAEEKYFGEFARTLEMAI